MQDRRLRPAEGGQRLLKRGEIGALCRAALAAEGPLDMRELAYRVAAAKGLDASDAELRNAPAYRIVQALTLHWKRKAIGSDGVRKGVRAWRVNESVLSVL